MRIPTLSSYTKKMNMLYKEGNRVTKKSFCYKSYVQVMFHSFSLFSNPLH